MRQVLVSVGWVLLLGCAGGAPAPSTPVTSGGHFAGHFGGNAFTSESVTGPSVQMTRRQDGSWAGLFPCHPFLGKPSVQTCAFDLDQRPDALTVYGTVVFSVGRKGHAVLLRRVPLEYEFATEADRDFPQELVVPLFLAVTSAKNPEADVVGGDTDARLGIFDNQSRFVWVIQVEGLGRVAVRRGPAS